MNKFLKRSAEDRAVFFQQAAAEKGLPAAFVEKDFWVVWTLGLLFRLPSLEGHLLFKGGTSLSKVYDSIERFSEDIDLSIHRDSLGFAKEMDPAQASSGKAARRGLDALAKACREEVQGLVQEELAEAIHSVLGDPQESWSLELDPIDGDGQTLNFTYPTSSVTAAPSQYNAPRVKIEFGARSDHWPAEQEEVQSYLAEVYPKVIENSQVTVKVLAVERTLWEKLTILHAEHHRPQGKTLPERYSRHYYDSYQLTQRRPELAASEVKPELLATVVEHKKVFFKSGWANYQTAKLGTLELLPPEDRLAELKADYQKMAEMIHGDRPPFEEILEKLHQWQDEFNARTE